MPFVQSLWQYTGLGLRWQGGAWFRWLSGQGNLIGGERINHQLGQCYHEASINANKNSFIYFSAMGEAWRCCMADFPLAVMAREKAPHLASLGNI